MRARVEVVVGAARHRLEGGFEFLAEAALVHVGPASFFLAYPDHGLIYRFTPHTVQTSEMEVVWLVRNDAREGADYDLDKLIWLWRVTSDADKQIIEDNQRGVNSRYYRPGPLSGMEGSERQFLEWYLSEIGVT